MKRSRGSRVFVAAVAALALVAAACGDDDGDGGAAPGAPSKSTIKIGHITSLSGPQAGSTRQSAVVAEAWEKWVNEEQGGINGHPVDVIVKDDGGDPSRGQAAARELVEDDDVLVIAGVTDNTIPAWADYVQQQGVAVVGGTSNQQAWYRTPALFPTPTDVASGLAGQVVVAKEIGKATKFANIHCAEIAACAEASPLLEAAAKAAGISYQALAISSSAPNYTAECLRLRQDGVDDVQLNFAAEAAFRFVQDCQRQGYNPTWGSSLQSIGESYFELDNFTVFGPAYAVVPTADHPKAEEFRNVMDEYADSDDWLGGGGSFAWEGLEVLRAALANVSDNPTRQEVFDAMYALDNEDLDGLLANPLKFTKGQPSAFGSHPCFFVVGVEDSEMVAPRNLDKLCAQQ